MGADSDSVARSRSPRRKTDVAEVVEITQLCATLDSELKRALDKAAGDASSVVLVLDLDETAFTPLTDDGLATSAWFEDIMQRWAPHLEEVEGMSRVDTLQSVLAVVDAFYPRVPVGLTDTELPALLQKCKKLGIATVGLTARRPELAPATWCQMGANCDLKFDALHPPLEREAVADLEKALRTPEHVPDPAHWEGISCERGIWFTANANKGSILRRLLEPSKHVIFADDSLRHVKAVSASMDGHASSVTALHFTAATSAAKKKLDPQSCDCALAGHVAALFAEQNPAIVELVNKRQTFLRRFITGIVSSEQEAQHKIDPSLLELAKSLSADHASL